MRKQLRYGDEGTFVTLREQSVAVLFVLAVAALLIGTVATPYGEPPGRIAQTTAAGQAESAATSASVADDYELPLPRSQANAP